MIENSDLLDGLIAQRQNVVALRADALCLLAPLLHQRLALPCCLPPAGLRDVDQFRVGLLEFLGGGFSFAAGDPMQLLGNATHAASTAAKDALAHIGGRAEHGFGLVEQAAENTHTIADERTISRVMDIGFDHGAVPRGRPRSLRPRVTLS